MVRIKSIASIFALTLLATTPVMAQKVIGDVSTTFRLLGANDKVIVERYDDPKVPNVACYVSRAETGGVMGSLGIATDPSRFSIACRAVGPVSMPAKIPDNEKVFSSSASILFKELNITRIVDREKNVLVYLVTSVKLINGSPFNSVTAVPVDSK